MGSLPASIILLAVMAYLPLDTEEMAEWIRYGLAFALPVSALAIVLYPIMMKTHTNGNGSDDLPKRTVATVLFGVALGSSRHADLSRRGRHRCCRSRTAVSGPAGQTDCWHRYRPCGATDARRGRRSFRLGHVDFGVLAALLVGSIPGILLGTRLAGVAPDWLLRPLLAVTLCYAAYALLTK